MHRMPPAIWTRSGPGAPVKRSFNNVVAVVSMSIRLSAYCFHPAQQLSGFRYIQVASKFYSHFATGRRCRSRILITVAVINRSKIYSQASYKRFLGCCVTALRCILSPSNHPFGAPFGAPFGCCFKRHGAVRAHIRQMEHR